MEFDWEPIYTAVDHVAKDEDGKISCSRVLLEEGFPQSEELIERINTRLTFLVKRKSDTGAGSPCKAFHFDETEKGSEDMELLSGLATATSLEQFGELQSGLQERLKMLMLATGCLMVTMKYIGSFGDTKHECVYVDLIGMGSAASLEVNEDNLDIHKVDDTLAEGVAQALTYPFVMLHNQEARGDLVKINNQPAKHPFPAMFAINPPHVTEWLLQQELGKALQTSQDGSLWGDRNGYFKKLAPAKRTAISGDGGLVKREHRLNISLAAALARESARTAADLYSKEQKLTLQTDGAKVSMSLADLGENVFFAKTQGECFVVLRTRDVKITAGPLSAVDFLDAPSLEDLLSVLNG